MSKSSSFARSRVILATVSAASLFSVGNLAQNAGIAGHTAIARAAAADFALGDLSGSAPVTDLHIDNVDASGGH